MTLTCEIQKLKNIQFINTDFGTTRDINDYFYADNVLVGGVT
ncbi:MAG: hypothetical protein V3W20_02155 [Candidatus Neomarinimicrobiota bacterium]